LDLVAPACAVDRVTSVVHQPPRCLCVPLGTGHHGAGTATVDNSCHLVDRSQVLVIEVNSHERQAKAGTNGDSQYREHLPPFAHAPTVASIGNGAISFSTQ
jgi:hypothetical protein